MKIRRKKELPLLLYKQPTILYRNGKSIIAFEYFNVKKYRYEVFEVDQSFSAGATAKIEMQRKKVYKALKRGFAPDTNLIECKFITHTIKMEDIDKVVYLSNFYLILCEVYGWGGNTGKNSAGAYLGILIGCECFQLLSIISLLTKKPEIADAGFFIGIGLFLVTAFIFDIVYMTRVEEKYYSHYAKLSSDFKDHIARIIITIAFQAVAASIYFFIKV